MDPLIRTKLMNLLSHIITGAVVIYVLFILGRIIWVNWQLNNQVKIIESQIEKEYQEEKDLQNLIVYYQSNSFKEIEARRKLGLKKPDETAIAIPLDKNENFYEELKTVKKRIAPIKENEKIPNWQLWWYYFKQG